MTKEFSENVYDELYRTLTEFENAPTDGFDGEEWLDVFYNLCVWLQNCVRNKEVKE